ncbi:MAG TPA: fatty acyl-AMP ligase [Gemmatimonadales bacterium]|nr:fatty acyl-AMP ligase [Gemmatimonadales bacterium]
MTALRTLPETLVDAARSGRGFRFLNEQGEERPCSYAEMLELAARLGGALRANGLKRGDRIALVIQDPEGFLTAFLGASLAGLVPVPVCPPSSFGAREAYLATTEHVLAAAKVSALLTAEPLEAGLRERADHIGVSLVHRWDELHGPALASIEPAALSDPAFMQFTSGSTAHPKGVVLTHANLASNAAAICGPRGLALGPEDFAVSWLPLHHDMGLIGMALASVWGQVNTAIMPPVLFLKRPTEWLKAIHRYRGTLSFAPSFAYELCLRRFKPAELEQLDLSCWRVAGCGAEPVRADTLEAFAHTFAAAGFNPRAFMPCYGMAEHTLAITFASQNRSLQVDEISSEALVVRRRAAPPRGPRERALRIVNCGRPFPGHEVRIVDEYGLPLPERAVGEIVARGPSVMQGYFEQPESTARALRDGWLHTGDEGYLSNGDLYVCGRQKDIVIVNGRNFYPEDLEWAVGELPGVRSGNVVAFGVGGLGSGDRERVVVVVESKGKLPADELALEVRRRIVDSVGLQVDEVVIAPSGTVQRTSSGKVKRSQLKSQFESGTLRTKPTPTWISSTSYAP